MVLGDASLTFVFTPGQRPSSMMQTICGHHLTELEDDLSDREAIGQHSPRIVRASVGISGAYFDCRNAQKLLDLAFT
jgi:hypothetical protein